MKAAPRGCCQQQLPQVIFKRGGRRQMRSTHVAGAPREALAACLCRQTIHLTSQFPACLPASACSRMCALQID